MKIQVEVEVPEVKEENTCDYCYQRYREWCRGFDLHMTTLFNPNQKCLEARKKAKEGN